MGPALDDAKDSCGAYKIFYLSQSLIFVQTSVTEYKTQVGSRVSATLAGIFHLWS